MRLRTKNSQFVLYPLVQLKQTFCKGIPKNTKKQAISVKNTLLI